MLVMIIIVSLQMLIYTPLGLLYNIIPNESLIIMLINMSTFIVLFVSRNNAKYNNILEICAKKIGY